MWRRSRLSLGVKLHGAPKRLCLLTQAHIHTPCLCDAEGGKHSGETRTHAGFPQLHLGTFTSAAFKSVEEETSPKRSPDEATEDTLQPQERVCGIGFLWI